MTAQQRRKRRMIRRFAPTVALCAVIAIIAAACVCALARPVERDTQPEAASTETVAAATKIAPAITKAAEQITKTPETITPEAPEEPAAPEETETEPDGMASRVNLNTADAAALECLPGIGPALAQRIIDYRTANGPFQTTAEIQDVRGIGAGIYEKIKDSITVE